MNKRILILGNPGKGSNYCEGVEKDLKNYKDYFQSIRGGAWENDEIKTILQPSVSDVNKELELLDDMDYSMVIFSGHGYSNSRNETVLELSVHGDEYKDTQIIKNNRTVIIDCCRKLWLPESIQKRAFVMDMAESTSVDKRKIARMKYENSIKNSNGMAVAMYSCSLDEYSYDNSELGGNYSYQLLENAKLWKKESDYNNVLDVAQAHHKAKKHLEYLSDRQHPRIIKARSGNYYPFAVDV